MSIDKEIEESIKYFFSDSKPKIRATEEMRNVSSLVLVMDEHNNVVKALKNRNNYSHHIPTLAELLIYMQTTPDLKILVLDEKNYVFSSNFDVIPYVWNN